MIAECRCAPSWCNLDLTCSLPIVTLTFKILSRLYLKNHKVQEVETWSGRRYGGVGVYHYGVTLIKCPARDACLYMGEATLPDPHFVFGIASQP